MLSSSERVSFSASGALVRTAKRDLRHRLPHHARSDPWELPALGPVGAPSAVLIRPDRYVAWVGDQSKTGLTTR